MWKLRCSSCLISLLLMLCCSAASVAAKGSRARRGNWQTLHGDQPIVIAKGGFSGVFADSSRYAYQLALIYGSSNLHFWCNVQLTKDGAGICFPRIKLDNASNINVVYPNRSSSYPVKGEPVPQGWFSVDFTLEELGLVNLQQSIYSRAPYFDRTPMQILTVDDVVSLKPHGLWLNIQYDAFYTQHNLSMRSFIISASRRVVVNYISSPDIGFLKSITSRFRRGPTELVFQFLEKDKVEPSMNQTYDVLSRNLTFVKTFATGILVPKTYIWQPTTDFYLSTFTNLVGDAHRLGLKVFVSGFVNDLPLPYDYSYDPVAEYLSFIDNGNFSVDGVLSDFPLTPTSTIDCFSHMGNNDTVQAKVLIISSEGASGDYPGCTDMAYKKAVADNVDILDCPVQVTSDGIAFCLGSINLRERTDALVQFGNRAMSVADLGIKDGILAYNLTWSEIQKLKPAFDNIYSNYSLFRNPRANNKGNLLQLSEFLTLANNESSISGVLISIENAAYLADKQGLGVTDFVLDALDKAGYNNQTAKRIMIKSSDSAVLKKFKSSSKYELVYDVDKDVSDILNETISEIKTFANAVIVSKRSVFPSEGGILSGETTVVSKLQAFKLLVFVRFFHNEFVSQAWDYLSDPYVEINTHVSYMGIDGVITEYPKTAAKYKRNRCLGYKVTPNYMLPVQPGGLIKLMTSESMPPAEAPDPVWRESDVVEPPLPAVRKRLPDLSTGNSSSPSGSTSLNGQLQLDASIFFSVVSIICSALLF